MAAGRVCTGYSKPYVAVYSESSGTVTYTGGMRLGRGVSVSLDIDAAEAHPASSEAAAEPLRSTASRETLSA